MRTIASPPSFVLTGLLHSDYLTRPLDLYEGNLAPDFSKEDLGNVCLALQAAVEEYSLNELPHTNVVYWLVPAYPPLSPRSQ